MKGDRGTPFGRALGGWRRLRGVSQLELGLRAGVSARHISFIETGRSRPSAEMVLRLAVALDLPLRSRNDLLLDAGFAPLYGERSIDDEPLAEARRALRFILDMHEPYPAFVIDRTWQLVMWNRTQGWLLREAIPAGGSAADLNAIEMVFAPGPIRESFLNWEEVAAAVLRRLERQVRRTAPGDPLRKVLAGLLAMPEVAALAKIAGTAGPPPILVPMRVRQGDLVLTWFSTLAAFGAAGDVTLDELIIESFFPGDDVTRAFVERAAAAAVEAERAGSAHTAEEPGPRDGRGRIAPGPEGPRRGERPGGPGRREPRPGRSRR